MKEALIIVIVLIDQERDNNNLKKNQIIVSQLEPDSKNIRIAWNHFNFFSRLGMKWG